MKSFLILTALVSSSLIGQLGCLAKEINEANEALFVRRIAPLLQEKCVACHGRDTENIEGGLDLRHLSSTLRGGDSGVPAIVTDSFGDSPLYLAATRQSDEWSAMPPKESEQLSEEQLQWLRDWIAGGASWPDDSRATEINLAYADQWSAEDGVIAITSGGLSPDWTNRRYQPEGLWAYQPLRPISELIEPGHASPQASQHTSNSGDAIDALIEKRMPKDLPAAPAADRATLIRRATFDLTGLPPTPEEVEDFECDPRGDVRAFSRVIDRLLDSPHYGERMAQHWLDVVRYADSSGFANDYERGNAWRYRDYVVRSFNDDKPYDQFIMEQIAGDEIAEVLAGDKKTMSQYHSAQATSSHSELLIATGFLRMGPWELTGMEVAKVARQRFLDDVTNSVGETFLAHSLQCARCHDHKFDPIPTRDYYSVQAVFATTQLTERDTPFLDRENQSGFEERRYLEARSGELKEILDRLNKKITIDEGRKWLKEMNRDSKPFEDAVAELQDKAQESDSASNRNEQPTLDQVRKRMQNRDVQPDLIPPPKVGFSPDDFGNERVARKGLERLAWELDRYEPYALAVYDGRTPQVKSVMKPVRMPDNPGEEGELEKSCILTGGDPFASGEAVLPGVLSILGSIQSEPIPDSMDGRRLAFAKWVASPENPLTTRAIVNRIWLWHFNQPIAGNPNNFGSTGKLPTHPELLDWLAATFVESGWSFKALHRRIMLSETYRRAASHPEPAALAKRDPSAISYAVFNPRRLTAEELRDAMLSVTGELNPMLGGIPARPEINLEAAMQPRQVMGTFAAAWTPHPLPEHRHRRSIYTLKLRGLVDPMLEVFNSPTPDFSCERRDASTVTPQVFSLFNGQASHARALAMANRAASESANDADAIKRCYLLAYGRHPTDEEQRLCLQHWAEIESMLPDVAQPMVAPALSVHRDAVEENTGERFSFEETLYSNEDFVPDLQPRDVPKHILALADVCLVILNANEFVYLY